MGGGELLESGSVLKAEPAGFPGGSDVGCDEKEGGEIKSEVLA
jgi:hypothetical protein